MRRDVDAADPEIVALGRDEATIAALSAMMIEIVADGSSVTFMYPLAPETARAFWDGALAAADRGEKVILGARCDGELCATVTLHLDCPQNQPHRAEIAKLMTRLDRRGRGLARALMLRAEEIAVQRGRTLITLDTAVDGGASGLYEGLGYTAAGTIPDYAYTPLGGLSPATFFWKRIGAAAQTR